MREHPFEHFDHLAHIHVISFVKRWQKKIRKGSDLKTYAFDAFIAHYIAFAALVDVLKPHDNKSGNDRYYCTTIVCQVLLYNYSNHPLFWQQLNKPAEAIATVISQRNFSVFLNGHYNPNLSNNWYSADVTIKLNSLLETLYALRCNLFHGAKEFGEDQVALLIPAVQALKVLNKGLISSFDMYVESLSQQ